MNEEEQNIELINLTAKKLTREASNAELERLDILLSENNYNQKTYGEIAKTWEESKKAKGITKQEVEEEWERLFQVIEEKPEKRATFSIYKIAATITLIIVGAVITYTWFQGLETTIVADNIREEILSDGSIVTLNSDASLTYSKKFNQDTREVDLTGEAYFEVESNKDKPFIIHTGSIDITVIGTSFNVRALENSETSEVVVNTGKVKLSSETKSVLLVAGEKGTVIKKSGKLFKTQNNNPNFQAWKTKNFEFRDTPLQEVIDLLNEVYDKSLYIEKNQSNECLITVSFQNQSFEPILKVLKSTLDLTIEETSKGLSIISDNC